MELISLVFVSLMTLGQQGVSSQVCSRVELTQFIAEPSIHMGVVPLRASSMTGCATGTSHPGFNCLYHRNILGDSAQVQRQPNLDSEDSNNDIGKFLVWSREAANPLISFRFNQPMTVTSLNIEFLNYPTQNFSLPNLQLYRSPSYFSIDPDSSGFQRIPYDLLNNGGLSQDDYTVTTVSMTFSAVTSQFFLLTWNYADVYNLDFFMVSEMYFCTDSVPPASNVEIVFQTPQISNSEIVPTVEDVTSVRMLVLNCTVSSAGLYEWRWRQNNVLISNNADFHIFTADGTRTSKLQLTGLSVDDAASYTCEVQHVRSNGNTFVPRTQILSFPVIVNVPKEVVAYLNEVQVSLTCEVSGFLRSTTSPTWFDGNGRPIVLSSKFTITSSGTSQPSVRISDASTTQGQRSILSIAPLTYEDEGNYTCAVEGNSSTVHLTITTNTPPRAEPSTTGTISTDPKKIPRDCTQTAAVASIISSLITALITVSISVILAVFIGRNMVIKKLSGSCPAGESTNNGVYETMDDKNTGVAMTMKENEAYGTANEI